MTQKTPEQEFAEALANLRDTLTLAVLPFFAWLCPKLGMRLKPKYQRMLDDR